MNEKSLTPDTGMDAKAVARGAPVASTERIGSIDKLRGIAVAGILFMNIYWFAMPGAAYSNPLAYGGVEWYNLGTWYFTHLFFDQKFLPIFSMLFGAGLVMMTARAEAKGAKYGGVWLRRNFWLLIIGAFHAYMIWSGDILFPYAVIGLMIYPLRNRKPLTLIIIAILLLPIAPLFAYGGGAGLNELQSSALAIKEIQAAGKSLTAEQLLVLEQWDALGMFVAAPDEQVPKQLESYRKGYIDIVADRIPFVYAMQTQALLFSLLWRIGGLMILGMALMKLGVLSGERSDSFYKKLMFAGYGVGFPLVLFSAYDLSAHQWDGMYVFRLGGMWNYVGSILVSLGHISVFMMIINSGALRNLMQRFAALGRMALTNYLMHSVILTTVFYGYGLGLYGTIPRFWQMGFVVAVVAFQLWFSPYWLGRYRFGPVEWLWRSLTYWKRQLMRRQAI